MSAAFDDLVGRVVRDLDSRGITLTGALVQDELRAMLCRPESAGGLPEGERLDVLGPEAGRRLAERLRVRLGLPDLHGAADGSTSATSESDDTDGDGEGCRVIAMAPRRRS